MPFREHFSDIMDVIRGHCRLLGWDARAAAEERLHIEARIHSALSSTIALISEVEDTTSGKERAQRRKDRFLICFIIR